MTQDFVPPERVSVARGQAANVALLVVGGSKELFAGLHEVMALWPELDIEDDDEHLGCLLDIAEEIEDLPVGPDRGAWPRRLLAELDQEIGNARRLHRAELLRAFRILAQRFAADRRSSREAGA